MKKLNILVSNDDGIHAEGIFALVHGLKAIADVTVVAPASQQSAVGHAITVNYPLRVFPFHKNNDFFGHAVEGTPADCVKLGVKFLLKQRPDMVISGINHGSNTAINIIYSGTVSAATEGTILGIPSVAVSLTSYQSQDFSYAAKFATRLALLVAEQGLPPKTLLNVNVPAVSEEEIKGVKITRQGISTWEDRFDVRRDPANREYFWLTGNMNVIDTDPDSDQIAIRENYVSVTPVKYELTDHILLERMKQWGVEELK
ncbi:MAG: 5'/3'-nucleotidase SurE [Bacteroidetes bacterium]|nr:5'/3'-nucleotidase SurE [Bacteroidota bacterium]MCW5896542.1 5'/3'-nucleotidase SurE [Bacteroidota bacterium]